MTIGLSPRDRMEAQLDQVDFLRAMYPSAEEMSIDSQTQILLSELRQWCDDGDSPVLATVPELVFMLLTLPVTGDGNDEARTIPISIEVPLKESCITSAIVPANMRVRLRQPDWLTKAETAQLIAGMDEHMDAISAIEHIRMAAITHLEHLHQNSLLDKAEAAVNQPMTRVWFYFPSISTREKRDDIVKYAPNYGLTGFLLAGKPGILCLEGGAQDIDDYMHFIKTESWGDIPSQHKKVSERYREDLGDVSCRSFSGMEEITDQLEKRGERSNRGDMKALERWLGEKGLRDAFSKVLM